MEKTETRKLRKPLPARGEKAERSEACGRTANKDPLVDRVEHFIPSREPTLSEGPESKNYQRR